MVAIEERVHPTPFRTRKLSSPSPMILHNVMWESRPLPKIVRDPLAAHSARGSFFVPALPGIFLFWGRNGLNYRQCSSLFLMPAAPAGEQCLVGERARLSPFKRNIVRQGRQADAGRFEEREKCLRGGKPFGKKVLPPRAPPLQKLLPVGLCEDGSA